MVSHVMLLEGHLWVDTLGAKKPANQAGFLLLAEREGFEPSIRYKRIHTFQACSLSHSDTSPDSITILSANGTLILHVANYRFVRLKKWQRIIRLEWVLCQQTIDY